VALASPEAFPKLAVQVGQALWAGDSGELDALADRVGLLSPDDAARRLDDGNRRRTTLGHYSGAMFYYGGEWYWGIDRLYHLEKRLMALGLRTDARLDVLVPRPAIETGPLQDDGSLTLEIYPSVRSPYSSIIFDTVVDFATRSGVKLVTRPVLPMVMRGAPVTFAKGKYILFDASREAEALGMRWGNVYDPIGEPVRRALALFPWADAQGKGVALVSNFLRMAWRERVNTSTTKGLRKVVDASGLDWSEARKQLDDTNWEAVIEDNRLTMYSDGLWGVPSYRLLESDGSCLLSIWGQDRLWLVSRAIQRRLRERAASA
jgi:2-hydroxychromene-2-carboxylate isomerase